jgi:hypothetical protein
MYDEETCSGSGHRWCLCSALKYDAHEPRFVNCRKTRHSRMSDGRCRVSASGVMFPLVFSHSSSYLSGGVVEVLSHNLVSSAGKRRETGLLRLRKRQCFGILPGELRCHQAPTTRASSTRRPSTRRSSRLGTYNYINPNIFDGVWFFCLKMEVILCDMVQ